MSGSTDKVKGRLKQAAGSLTGNDKLQREGRLDEEAGKAKDQAEGVIKVARDKIEDVSDRLHTNSKDK